MIDESGFVNRKKVSIETLQRAIINQSLMITGVINFVIPQIKDVVDRCKGKVSNIYMVGCGDSLYAAMATRYFFEQYSGYNVESIEALEFSRYTVDFIPQNSLVIGISAGGNKSRTFEAIQQANNRGAITVAITGEKNTTFNEEACMVIHQNEFEYRIQPPDGEGTFKLGNYLSSMLCLYMLSLELGVDRGKIDQDKYNDLLFTISCLPQEINETFYANENAVRKFVRSIATSIPYYTILGGGPNFATALYMAAKLFEMPQLHGVPVELEEWAHEQFFLTRDGSIIFVICPPGNSLDRARELIVGAKEMGAMVVAICDINDQETVSLAHETFPIISKVSEEFSPLVYMIPGQLFAMELCRILNKPAFAFINNKQYELNKRLITSSALRKG